MSSPLPRPAVYPLLPLLLLLLLSTLSLAQSTGGKFCNSYICVTISLRPDQTADIKVETVRPNPGWIGFGVGSSMLTSDLTVMWVNQDDSSITFSRRKTSSYAEPHVDANQTAITPLTTTAFSLSSPVFEFTRPQALEYSNLDIHQTTFLWAYATAKPASKAFDSALMVHIDKGSFTLDLTQPITSSGNVLSSGSSISSLTGFDKLVYSHGTIMFFAWGILVPAGVLVARFGRHLSNWVLIHQSIQFVAVGVLTFIGFWLGFVQSYGSHVGTYHQIIGVTIFIAAFLQLFLGIIIHRFRNPVRRPIRNWVHRIFGPLILILSFVQIPLGLQDYHAPAAWSIAFYVWIAVLVLLFAGLTLWQRQRSKRQDQMQEEK